MNNASFDSAEADKQPIGTASSGELIAGSGPAGDHSTKEIARLNAECERLSAQVRNLEEANSALEKALSHFLWKDVTPEMMEQQPPVTEGLPLSAFFHELEAKAAGNQNP